MKTKKILSLCLLLISISGLTGCGPEQTQQEKTRDQVREDNKEKLKLQEENLKEEQRIEEERQRTSQRFNQQLEQENALERARFDQEQAQRNIQAQENLLYPLAGHYEGVLKYVSGGEVQAMMDLGLAPMSASNLNMSEAIAIPSLVGGLSVCSSATSCLGANGQLEKMLPVGNFTSAVYNQAKKRLVMHSAASAGGATNGLQSYVDVFADGKVIEGNYGTTFKAIVGKLYLKRRN